MCDAAPVPTSATSPRVGRSKNNAGASRRAAPLDLPQIFTTAGKIFGKTAGARELDIQALKEIWYYYFQCTECRRCSLFCPYGIDQAEITIIGRELLNLLGLNIDWIAGPAANCYRKGNHLGLEPHTIRVR